MPRRLVSIFILDALHTFDTFHTFELFDSMVEDLFSRMSNPSTFPHPTVRSDSDSQCQPGLRCFFRSDLRAIPGCQGEGIRAKDYCYDPTFVATSQRDPNPTVPPPTPRPPTPRPPTNPPPTAPALQFATLKRVSNKNCGNGQCGKCEGDCDNDQECQKGEFLTRSTCIVRPNDFSFHNCAHRNILF